MFLWMFCYTAIKYTTISHLASAKTGLSACGWHADCYLEHFKAKIKILKWLLTHKIDFKNVLLTTLYFYHSGFLQTKKKSQPVVDYVGNHLQH